MFMKKCKKCNEVLSLDNFYKDKRGVYSSRCKSCHTKTNKYCAACGKNF